jgi:hypothetical protein
MPPIRALTVAVGEWYAHTLSICLPRNAHHFTEIYVITTPKDNEVKAVVAGVPNAILYETEEFFAYGASFNKGVCVERCFDVMGRHGWILIHDADILLPDSLPQFDGIAPGKLYGARRRLLENPADWTPELDWRKAKPTSDGSAPVGFFQLFSADDPHIKDRSPWYCVNSPHAGLGDAYFLDHWPRLHRRILPLTVLHLGPRDRFWWGTDEAAVDKMAAYVHHQNWQRAMKEHDPTAADRVGDLIERVDVPGYQMLDYMMPFERRARDARKAR